MTALLDYCFKEKHEKPTRFLSRVRTSFNDAAERVNAEYNDFNFYDSKKEGAYPCIHYPVDTFAQDLRVVFHHLNLTRRSIKDCTFLDVGCGVGQKVFMAHKCGFEAHGIELRPQYIEEAIRLFKQRGIDNAERFFKVKNALEYKDYSNFDIIYFYCPLWNNVLQKTLEKTIAEQAMRGTIVIANLSKYLVEKNLKNWRPIHEGRIMQKL